MTNLLYHFELEDCKVFLIFIKYVFKFIGVRFCDLSSADEVTHSFLVS